MGCAPSNQSHKQSANKEDQRKKEAQSSTAPPRIATEPAQTPPPSNPSATPQAASQRGDEKPPPAETLQAAEAEERTTAPKNEEPDQGPREQAEGPERASPEQAAPLAPEKEEAKPPPPSLEELAAKLGLSELKVFDSVFAMEQVGDDVEFLVEMKDSMVEMQADTVSSCRAAVASREWRTIFEKAHALKGAVSNIGLDRIRAVALALETSGRSFAKEAGEEPPPPYSEEEIPLLIDLVEKEWVLFAKEFEEEVSKLSSAS